MARNIAGEAISHNASLNVAGELKITADGYIICIQMFIVVCRYLYHFGINVTSMCWCNLRFKFTIYYSKWGYCFAEFEFQIMWCSVCDRFPKSLFSL